MKRYIKSSRNSFEDPEFQAGWNKAMELSNGHTYMYDSTKRIFELADKDPEYEAATSQYKSGFAQAVYSLFRC